jgi:hypothetical protein
MAFIASTSTVITVFSLSKQFPDLRQFEPTIRAEIVRQCQRDAAAKLERSSVIVLAIIVIGLGALAGVFFNAALPVSVVAAFAFGLWCRHRIIKLMHPLINWEIKRRLRLQNQSHQKTVSTWIKRS